MRSITIRIAIVSMITTSIITGCSGGNSNDGPAQPRNSPPDQAVLAGRSSVFEGQSNPFVCRASDPEGESVGYEFDWNGDALPDEESGAVPSGSYISARHTFSGVGTYTVMCRAKDSANATGDWSNSLSMNVIEMPTAQNSPFGIYSPYGEFQLDGGTFATPNDISGHLKDLGVTWVQELPFFNKFDAIPSEIEVYSRVGREAGMSPTTINDPAVVENYKAALAQTIKNKKGRVTLWEVDTEPDGVGGWRENPSGYAELLKITRQVIKSECEECTVIFGGLSGGSGAMDPESASFLNEVLSAGGVGYFDGLEFKRHHTSAKDYSLLKTKFDSIGGILSGKGLNIHEMPIFVETAMYDGDPNDPVPKPLESGLPIQTEGEQAAGLIKTYLYGLSLGIDKIFWNFIFERSDYEAQHAIPFPQNPFNHYGLINYPTNGDGLVHIKLVYYTYKKMVEVLEGSDWNTLESVWESADVHIYKLMRNGSPVYIAWWDYFNDPEYTSGMKKQVAITNIQGSVAVTTEAVPKFATGAEVTEYSTAFNTSTLTVSTGAVTLDLGENPVFVEALQ